MVKNQKQIADVFRLADLVSRHSAGQPSGMGDSEKAGRAAGAGDSQREASEKIQLSRGRPQAFADTDNPLYNPWNTKRCRNVSGAADEDKNARIFSVCTALAHTRDSAFDSFRQQRDEWQHGGDDNPWRSNARHRDIGAGIQGQDSSRDEPYKPPPQAQN